MPSRLAIWIALLNALALTASATAEAQVRFSIGGNGWSVGNVPPGYPYGYGYGPGYGWGPRYAPAVVIERHYSQPQVQYVPVPAASRPQAYAGRGVAIRNPEKSETTLSYTIDGDASHEITAGETQRLTSKGRYLIEFDRGGDFGEARYTIYEGLYEFALTSHGWELYRQRKGLAETAVEVKPNPLPATDESNAVPRPAEPEHKQPPPPAVPQET